jgi:acyl-CoA dehydrogenase
MMWAHQRTLRIADGPDEVHLQQMGRNESKRAKALQAKLEVQRNKAEALLRQYGIQAKSHL